MYGFDTESKPTATAALLVYAIYRSRNKSRFKVSLDMWGRIERFTKASAKRAQTAPDFIEKLKTKMSCESISPRWCEVGLKNDIGLISAGNGAMIQVAAEEQREFLTRAVAEVDENALLNALFKNTAWVVLLVRERLEREKPQEKFIKEDDASE